MPAGRQLHSLHRPPAGAGHALSSVGAARVISLWILLQVLQQNGLRSLQRSKRLQSSHRAGCSAAEQG